MAKNNQLQQRWAEVVHSLRNETLEEIFPHTMAHSLSGEILTIRFDTLSDQNRFFSATNDLLRKVREEFGEKTSLSAITKRRSGEREDEEETRGLTHYETNTMTFMEGAFTSTQNKIIQRIIYESELEMREKLSGEPVQLELFKEESDTKMRVVKIKMNEIGRSNNYKHISEAVERLRVMPIRIPIKTEKYTGEYVTSIVHSYFLPSAKSWRKEIILTIDRDILQIMQTALIAENPDGRGTGGEVVTGYTNPLAKGYNRLGNYDVVLNTTNNRFTQRIYKFLTAFRDRESFAMSIRQLRRILGLDDSYLRWADFRKTVLTEPYEEMMEHRGEWEFRFEWEEIRRSSSKKAGEPDGIKFYVKNNEEEERMFQKQKVETEEERTLRQALDVMETQVTTGEAAITMEQWLPIRKNVKDSAMMMRLSTTYQLTMNHIYSGKVKNTSAYMYRALRRETDRDADREREMLIEEMRRREGELGKN